MPCLCNFMNLMSCQVSVSVSMLPSQQLSSVSLCRIGYMDNSMELSSIKNLIFCKTI